MTIVFEGYSEGWERRFTDFLGTSSHAAPAASGRAAGVALCRRRQRCRDPILPRRDGSLIYSWVASSHLLSQQFMRRYR